jgi:hypothetical protein
MARRMINSRAKARAIDLKALQQRLTLAAASVLFVFALLLLIRP